MKIDLKGLRDKARRSPEADPKKSTTREELSLMLEEALGRKIHVTQIARYEDDPGNVPIEILVPWLRCLGTSIEEQVSKPARIEPVAEFNPGAPYQKLRARVSLLIDYLESAKQDPDLSVLPAKLPNNNLALEVAETIGRKPNVVLSGAFDVGKSTIANWLMNADGPLPTQYQPTTAVVTYVRHLEDKPAWLREDVVLLKAGFDPDLWADEQHVQLHRIVSGDLETLRRYGTHNGDRYSESGADTAILFLDSMILKSCNLIDFPGYQNNDEDTLRANKAVRHMDVLLYASTAIGFMNAQDLERLRYLLKQLPDYERTSPELSPLGNLFIIATHAGPQIDDRELYGENGAGGLLNVAAERVWRELGDLELSVRGEQTGKAIDRDLLRARIFPFWRENSVRTAPLATGVIELLSKSLPLVIYREANRKVQEFKSGARNKYKATIDAYESVLANISEARILFEGKIKEEPARKRKLSKIRDVVTERMLEIKAEHTEAFSRDFAAMIDLKYIEEEIRARYGIDKKEAQQYMAGFLVNQLQSKSENFVKAKSGEVSELMESYVAAYDHAAGIEFSDGRGPVQTPFDARGSFVGGLAGLGSIGALSLWASTLGNLGGYIIAAKAVSVLSALGIATGGTASMMGLLSAVGGPVTMAIGLALTLFFGLRAIFGDSWQTRLARQIVDQFKKDGVERKFLSQIAEYWDGAAAAFERGAEAVERDFVAEMTSLAGVYDDVTKVQEAERLVASYKKAQDFFVNMPWVPLHQGQVT